MVIELGHYKIVEPQQRLDAFYKNIPLGIYRTTRDRKIISVNPALADILGYDTAEEMVGLPVLDFYHRPERRNELIGLLDQETMIKNFVAEMRRRDGAIISVSMDLSVMTDLQSDIYYLDGVMVDITQQLRAENARAESEQRLHSLVEQAPIGIVTIDMEGIVTEINPSGLEILGSPGREATIGLNVLALPSLVEFGFSERFRKVLQMGTLQDFEIKYISIWGKESHLHARIAPQLDAQEEQIGALCILEDITQRKRAEEAERESEERHHALIQNASQAVIISDSQGNINNWNAGAQNIFGYTADEVLGKPLTIIIPERYHEAHLTGIDRIHKTGVSNISGEVIALHGLRNDGSEFPLELSLSNWKSGEETSYGAIIQDISERVETDMQLKQQLTFSTALKLIADLIITNDDADRILHELVQIMGEALETDRTLIFDIQRKDQLVVGLCEWLNPAYPEISPTLDTYPLHDFHNGDAYFWETRSWLESHNEERNPHLVEDGSAESLHDRRDIESMLWYPFSFHDDGYYLLVFNQNNYQRHWTSPEHFFLDAVIRQINLALQKIAFLEERSNAEAAIQELNEDLEAAYDETLAGWANALELRDHETEGHSRRVVEMTMLLARAMQVDEELLPHIYRGALLHDIGKFGVSDNILFKAGDLTEDEWDAMRKHPQYAYDLLSPIRYLHPALDIPYLHHEHWDGSGYPHGLKGEDIPLSARIFAVVDVWDALLNDRPYHEAWPEERVLAYIKEKTGKQFDPQVVDAFIELLKFPAN